MVVIVVEVVVCSSVLVDENRDRLLKVNMLIKIVGSMVVLCSSIVDRVMLVGIYSRLVLFILVWVCMII